MNNSQCSYYSHCPRASVAFAEPHERTFQREGDREVVVHNTEPFAAGSVLAPVCRAPLSALCTISPFCFPSCTPSIGRRTRMPSHSFSIYLAGLLPLCPPTLPSRLLLSPSPSPLFCFPAHCGDKSFEQHPKALPPVDLSLGSPPPTHPLPCSLKMPACSSRTHSPLPGGEHH